MRQASTWLFGKASVNSDVDGVAVEFNIFQPDQYFYIGQGRQFHPM